MPYDPERAKQVVKEGSSPLTVRELEILELVKLGLTNKGIANKLGISELSVKNHLRITTQKMGFTYTCTTRFKCLYKAMEYGLIDPPQLKAQFVKIPSLGSVLDSSENVDTSDWIRFRNVMLSPSWRKLVIGGRVVKFTDTDFNILHVLMCKPYKVVLHDHIMSAVWGAGVAIHPRQIAVHIHKVRELLAQHRSEASIETYVRYGYRLTNVEEVAGSAHRVYDGI